MQSIIDGLAQLDTRAAHDRAFHVYIKDVLLDAHVVGEGFIETRNAADKAAADDEEQMEVQPSLFVSNGDTGDVIMSGDSEHIDDGR